MGRVPYSGAQPDIFEFYRFATPGVRLFSGNTPASAAYLSLDGGNTKLADSGIYSDPSDFLNPGPDQLGPPYSKLSPNDPFNEIYTGSTIQGLTAVDLQILDAPGFDTIPATVIEGFGSIILLREGANYFIESGNTGTGPEIKLGGTPITAGQYPCAAPISVEALANGGYELAWNLGGRLYSIWSPDSNGNYTGPLLRATPGGSPASFHQDLNGDGSIGIHGTIVEGFGSTILEQIGNNYLIVNGNTGTGPEAEVGGTPISVGQYPGAAPIGLEALANGGYELAWNLGNPTYSIWGLDKKGNYNDELLSLTPGNSAVLENFEASFHQDLKRRRRHRRPYYAAKGPSINE
jgi:hypothetical protein